MQLENQKVQQTLDRLIPLDSPSQGYFQSIFIDLATQRQLSNQVIMVIKSILSLKPKNPDDKTQTFYKSFGVLKFCGYFLVGLKSNELQ